ncbi:MAG TPA: DUF294 nucleotidyltransferase-like domain-containing protein, partial [Hyphomicrobiaceae bacterium]|nr:DUF294 nucleotidyltransferase-like domain-containing protein [Hyphomicrobiaceae bacterium]
AAPAAPPASDTARALARIDSFPYRHTVGDVMSAPPLWAEPTASVADALRLLLERRVSSVLVRDQSGAPGIATERDLIRAIARDGAAALTRSVSEVATRPLQSIPVETYVYRAIGRLDRLDFRHLAVADQGGEIIGIVTTRNLLRHRARTAIALGDEIDAAESVGALAAAWAKVPAVARALIDEDVDPRIISNVISTEVCAMTRRAAEIAANRMRDVGRGEAPCRYAVLVLGSGGRGESLLAADQDNAIVFEHGDPDGSEDRWFAELATVMAEYLDTAGIPFCKGGVMAKSAKWRQSVAGWHATVDTWVRRQKPEDLLNVDIFFDAAVVAGDEGLGDEVIAYAFARAHDARDFQMQMTELARRWQPPFTLFGNFKTGPEGRVDLKLGGLLPIFTAARVLALKHAIRARSTPERLRNFAATTGASETDIETLIGAQGVILKAMISQQLVDIETGIPPSPRVDLKRLDAGQRAQLKSAVQGVRIATSLVGEGLS